MQKTAAAEKVIDIVAQNKYVRAGPHFWVAKLLHQRGPLSSKKIWEEYLKDPTVEKGLLKSKTYLKERILTQMEVQGKVIKA
jgi:hypothetical protein